MPIPKLRVKSYGEFNPKDQKEFKKRKKQWWKHILMLPVYILYISFFWLGERKKGNYSKNKIQGKETRKKGR